MLSLYQDPDGNHIFSVNDPLGKVAPISTIFVNDAGRSDREECQELKAKVKKLEQTITEVFQVQFEATVYYTVEQIYFEGVNFSEKPLERSNFRGIKFVNMLIINQRKLRTFIPSK